VTRRFHVALGAGDNGAVDDADDRQRQEERGQRAVAWGEEVEVEADDAVGAQLGEDAGDSRTEPSSEASV